MNLGLYLLPYIQVRLRKHGGDPIKSPKLVTSVLEFTLPPADRLVKREIKEIGTQPFTQPQPTPSCPSTPGGGLKFDLSSADGEGMALVSGGDRTVGIGSETGRGQGNGMAAVTYEPGQTDVDARPINNLPLKYPSAHNARISPASPSSHLSSLKPAWWNRS